MNLREASEIVAFTSEHPVSIDGYSELDITDAYCVVEQMYCEYFEWVEGGYPNPNEEAISDLFAEYDPHFNGDCMNCSAGQEILEIDEQQLVQDGFVPGWNE